MLNLELFDGGLRPDRLSGGFETKSLHFKSGNGNVWAFRSVDKDPTRGLDPDTRDSIVGDYFRDQTSTAHPCGALVASPLLEAAGVDARAYLRARLMDVLIGDWDRHLEQWRWARYENDGERGIP